jgi:hypothetical protein
MNNINLLKHNYKLSTRNYSLSPSNNFKIPSIGLIQSFKILNYNEIKEKYKDHNLCINITIGNFNINTHSLFKSQDDIICIKSLRNYIRDIDFPETDFDNKLINFEHYLFSQQLKCTEHYYTINNKDLQNSIFTSGVNVYIDIKINSSENKDDSQTQIMDEFTLIEEELQIEETFWDKIYEDKVINK